LLILILILFLFLFLFLLLHANEVVVSHLFPAAYLDMTALSVAMAINLGSPVPQVETKMAPMMTTMAMTNETRHGAPSTHRPILIQGRVRARAMRARVVLVVVGGSGKDAIVATTIPLPPSTTPPLAPSA
jgi:hypothetical protein